MGEGEHLAVVGHRGIVDDVRFTTGRKSPGSVEVSNKVGEGGRGTLDRDRARCVL